MVPVGSFRESLDEVQKKKLSKAEQLEKMRRHAVILKKGKKTEKLKSERFEFSP